MKIFRSGNRFILLAIGAFVTFGTLTGCNKTNSSSDPMSAQSQVTPVSAESIQHAIDVQNRHTDDMMNLPGVNGTAVSILGSDAVVVVYTTDHNVQGIPAMLEDVKTNVQYLGEVNAFDVNTGITRNPMFSGYSVGNDNECAAGTISCVVEDASTKIKNPQYYILSNNHVFARENAARIGEKIDQPGRYDTQCQASGQVATLSKFVTIDFSKKANNVVDCAIAYLQVAASSTMAGGAYTPSSTTVNATLGMPVKKVGRTTGLQASAISAINGTVIINYGNGKNARFINQIIINSATFSAAGDSGSLICENTDANNYPVGLLFAGSATSTIANPIGSVLTALSVKIVAGTPAQ